MNMCSCARQHRPISRMWSTEMRWRGNSWCGHNWVTGSAVTSTPLLSPTSVPHLSSAVSILSGGEVAFVMVRSWQLSCTSVSLPLSQPSPLGKSTCPSLAQLQRSCSTVRATFFVAYSTHLMCAFEVIVTVSWMELKCGCVWLILIHLRWIPLPS